MLNFKEFIMENYVKLSADQLLKYGPDAPRVESFVQKIINGIPFELHKGGTIIIKKDHDLINSFKKAVAESNKALLKAMQFPATDGKNYVLTDLAKSGEFGGKGKGSGTVAEDAELARLKQKLQNILNDELVPYVFIKLGQRMEKVAAVESTPGTPKSDFHMLDDEGKEVFWLSHKKGTKANDFQQYGGMIEVQADPDVTQFAKDVSARLGNIKKLPPKTAYRRKVASASVRMKSLFGKDFKRSKADSRQNIDVLFQGAINFQRQGKKDNIPIYTISSNHTILHAQEATGDYEPYYYVRPEQAKTQFGITGARFFIVAKLTATKNRNCVEI
jgi:hypothetical protein